MGRRIRGQIRRRERKGLRRCHRVTNLFRQMYSVRDDIFDVNRQQSPFMRLVARDGGPTEPDTTWPHADQYTFKVYDDPSRCEELKSLRALWDEVRPELEASIAGWKRLKIGGSDAR